MLNILIYHLHVPFFREKMPRVHQHFSNGGVMWSIICAKWFICIYADVLPIEVSCFTFYIKVYYLSLKTLEVTIEQSHSKS